MRKGYIVPADILRSTPPPRSEWQGTSATGFVVWLVTVDWADTYSQDQFESIAGVVWLGNRWDPLPAEAVPLISALQAPASDTGLLSVGSPAVLKPLQSAVGETVANALGKIPWPGARMID